MSRVLFFEHPALAVKYEIQTDSHCAASNLELLSRHAVLLSRPIAILFLLAMLVPACSGASDYAAWLDEAVPADGPGVTALVMRDGEVVFRGAAGMANIELGVSMQPDHVMRIGSITKQFTAAAILLLQDRGKLDVSDEITKYLPDFSTQGESITVDQLLAHTSGIFSFTDIPGYWRGDLIRTDVSVAEMMELFADQPLQFLPGSQFSYSNSGYVLLGAIIERVSGKTYAEFMCSEIFEPLGLVDTRHGGAQLVPRRASGYEIGPDEQVRNALPISMTHPYAAGALLSTVDDLGRWNTALFDGKLLSEEAIRAMTTAAELNDGSSTEYGYGLYVRERDGFRVVSHSGGIHGFSTSAVWLPDERVYAVVLSNLENSNTANNLVWRFARDAATCGADCGINGD